MTSIHASLSINMAILCETKSNFKPTVSLHFFIWNKEHIIIDRHGNDRGCVVKMVITWWYGVWVVMNREWRKSCENSKYPILACASELIMNALHLQYDSDEYILKKRLKGKETLLAVPYPNM